MRIFNITFIVLVLISAQSYAAIYVPKRLWEKSTVKVCFIDSVTQIIPNGVIWIDAAKRNNAIAPSAVPNVVQVISNAVKSHYSHEQTGIQFTGFKHCSESNNNDAYIYLYYSNDLGPVAESTIGNLRRDDNNAFEKILNVGQRSIVSINIINHFDNNVLNTHKLTATTLHEFGHLSGLDHEHVHTGFLPDEDCFIGDTNIFRKYPTVEAAKFDEKSIMNYCQMNKMRAGEEAIQLSPVDKQALRTLYKD